ncbi:SMODS domain-containing nucleotidyltransferase [Streptomyces sp. NPDC002817]|uniref:SMODS domain-containing nucleotidyltransferase n=1 Tax=Streptomyces sp. NPDC088357 TaxID=3154655 RepID=UPI0034284469
MGIDDAFDALQNSVNEDIEKTRLARERRDLFKGALGSEPDVLKVFGSGSLSRSTQLKPIHDVDIIAIYDPDEHPEWGDEGPSAEAALEHIRGQVNRLLSQTNGTYDTVVRHTLLRNHAVKCFLDDPDDPEAFTVDVMAALRQADGSLLIPEKLSTRWMPADPEYLIEKVADHQRAWSHFRPLVRVLKQWRHTVQVEGRIKSLVMEVLALNCMPRSGNRSEGLKTFFTAAADRVNEGVWDPANLCGEVQPDLDRAGLSAAFAEAADIAERACAAAAEGDTDRALRLWQEIFGEGFPAPAAPAKATTLITAPALITPRPIKDAPQG